MNEFRCKDLGFDCNFTIKDRYGKVLIKTKEHLKSCHGVTYQEKFFQTIFRNKKQNYDLGKDESTSCDEYSCGISLEKWKPGHRNFP